MSKTPATDPGGKRIPILSLLTEVRQGEALGALLLALNVFLLLGSYYLLKTVRESLILSQSGAEIKSYAAAGQAVLLLIVIPLYGMLGARLPRLKLIAFTTLFFVANLAGFYLGGRSGWREGVAFYLWLGVYNNFVVAQFWGFANDIYTEEQGKRLFPLIGIGSSLGAWMGAEIAKRLFAPLGPYNIMLLVGGILLACLLLTWVVNRNSARQDARQRDLAERKLSSEGGFQLIFNDRYLTLIAALILVLNIVNSTGEFLLGKVVIQEALRVVGQAPELEEARGRFIGGFYGDFYGMVNLLGFLMQAFLASRIFKTMGVRGAIFILPTIALGSYSLLLAMPILSAVRLAKTLENSTDYSIQNMVRHALFLVTSREAKYKAKAAIDTFVVRSGDVLQALIVFTGTSMGLGIRQFAAIAVALSAVWLLIAWRLFAAHREKERVYAGDAVPAV
jgi:AAA family ATP:ADP antiporter